MSANFASIVPNFLIGEIDIDEIQNLDKIFTNREQRYCNSKSNPAIHYAGRFAAKEAVMKALMSSGYNKPISFCSISIINSEFGAPHVTAKFVISGSCQITISHTTEYATATALFILS